MKPYGLGILDWLQLLGGMAMGMVIIGINIRWFIPALIVMVIIGWQPVSKMKDTGAYKEELEKQAFMRKERERRR